MIASPLLAHDASGCDPKNARCLCWGARTAVAQDIKLVFRADAEIAALAKVVSGLESKGMMLE